MNFSPERYLISLVSNLILRQFLQSTKSRKSEQYSVPSHRTEGVKHQGPPSPSSKPSARTNATSCLLPTGKGCRKPEAAAGVSTDGAVPQVWAAVTEPGEPEARCEEHATTATPVQTFVSGASPVREHLRQFSWWDALACRV